MIPGADPDLAEISFRLFGIRHYLSMEQFGFTLGLYTEPEVRQPL